MVWVSIETRVSEVVLRQELFGPLRGQFESRFGFPLRPRQSFLGEFSGFPFVRLGARGAGAKQDRRELKVSHPNLDPYLGHKSGILCREKKGNKYATSTHFPCFLQNWSNCKTVLYLGDPPTDHHPLSSSWYCGHPASHRKTGYVFFKPWGSTLSQFFRIQFKGVRLELLAPICNREKKATSGIFLPEASLPALDGGVDRLHTKIFSFLVGLSLPLTDAGVILIPPGSTTETGWGCITGRPDGIPDWRPAPHH